MERPKLLPGQNVFSPEVATILNDAYQQGRQITMLHLFFSLYQDPHIADFMQHHGLGIDQARAVLSTLPLVMEPSDSTNAFSGYATSDPYTRDWRTFQVRNVLMRADQLALQESNSVFHARHLLQSMLMEGTGPVARLLDRAGLHREVLVQELSVPFPDPQPLAVEQTRTSQ